ncbi:hypothetical protein FPV67DRAFT_1208456 [Lyophyllum atratum]|nr:hypothetical protein FPV67DRAFT_1208456 [Lyophyllum atratum]
MDPTMTETPLPPITPMRASYECIPTRLRRLHGLGDLPPQWVQFVNLDGRPYFVHHGYKLTTYDDMRDPETRTEIERLQVELCRLWRGKKGLGNEEEVYIGLQPRGYYVVNNACEGISWAEDVALDVLMPTSVNDMSHVSFENVLLQNYYRHLESFPHSSYPSGHQWQLILKRLQTALVHRCVSAPSPWSQIEAKNHLNLLEHIFTQGSFNASGHQTWYVARLLQQYHGSRTINHPAAAEVGIGPLGPLQSFKIWSKRIFTNSSINMVQLYALTTCIDRLKVARTACIVSLIGWKNLLTAIFIEWSENLFATVYLSATMMFLAVYDLQPYNTTSVPFAVACSVGTLAAGFHHVWRHPLKKDISQFQYSSGYISGHFGNRGSRSLAFLIVILNMPALVLRWHLTALSCSLAMFAFSHSFQCPSCVVSPGKFLSAVGCLFAAILIFGGAFSVRTT